MQPPDIARGQFWSALEEGVMVPKSDHLANTLFDKKSSAQAHITNAHQEYQVATVIATGVLAS